MVTNLPQQVTVDSGTEVKQFFDKFYINQISFPSNQIDAVIGFFQKNGFDEQSAKSVSIVLLNQAREDNVNVFELLDSLKVLSDVQLSQIVAQVLNAYREKTSVLGYRVVTPTDEYENRNIVV